MTTALARRPRTYAGKVRWLRDWADENRLMLDLEGECGFGRDCVGITDGSNWVDVDYEGIEYATGLWRHKLERPLPDVLEADAPLIPWPIAPDAYHKHCCLAVLDPGRTQTEERVVQLYRWVRHCVKLGAKIERDIPRDPAETGNVFAMVLHGITRNRLTLSSWDEQEPVVAKLRAETVRDL